MEKLRRYFSEDPLGIFGMAVFSGLLFTACVFSSGLLNGIVNAKSIWFICCIGPMLVFLALSLKRNRVLRVNLLDILVLFMITGMIINNDHNDIYLASIRNMENVGLLVTYYFSKRLIIRRGFAIIVLVNIVLQLLIAFLQWIYYVPSFNNAFRITGFFFNPAPFAIYLAGLTAFALSVCFFHNNKFLKVIAGFTTLLSVLVEIILVSRSAWAGLACIGIILLVYQLILHRSLQVNKFIRWTALLIFAIALSISIRHLYLIKKDSADGRLLPWKISLQMFSDHPWFGIGQGGVEASYLKYQSAYFAVHQNKMANEGRLAGELRYSFNDVLQYAVEQGLMGLLLFLGVILFVLSIFISILKNKNAGAENRFLFIGAGLCIVVILTSGMFSYPLTVLPVKIIFFLSAGLLSRYYDQYERTIVISRAGRNYALMLSMLLTVCFFYYSFNSYRALSLAARINSRDDFSEPNISELKSYLWIFRNESWFELMNVEYHLRKNQYQQAILQLEETKKHSSDPRIYYTLASLYSVEKNNDAAESQYKFLYYALPDLLRPKYQLAKFFYETNQPAKGNEMAEEVIHFKPKIPSALTEQMQSEIKSIYKK